MTEWQPIETAPKDGTTILLWEGESGTECWVVPVTGSWDCGEWTLTCHGFSTLAPSHWMPLPDRPEVSEDRRSDRDGADAKSSKSPKSEPKSTNQINTRRGGA